MNKRARNQLIGVIAGLAMIVTGGCMFLSKSTLHSSFLESGGDWTWWKILLVLLPLIAGIVMLIVKPHLWVSKLIAVAGVVVIVVVNFMNTTFFIQERIAPWEWILYGFLIVGGLAAVFVSLFVKNKKHNE